MKKLQILGTGCPKCKKLAENTEAAAKAMGIDTELAGLGVEVFNFTQYGRSAAVPGVKFRNIEIATEHLPFDAMVNVAKAKTHAMMTLTLCVKNLFGMVKGSERMGWHLAVARTSEPSPTCSWTSI